jgi:hypothetical protein
MQFKNSISRVVSVYTATKIPFMYSQKKVLRGLSPNFHIDVSVTDLNISRIGRSTFLGRPFMGIHINRSLTRECGNWD